MSANSELEGEQLGNKRFLSLSMNVFITQNQGLANYGRATLIQPAACACIAHELRLGFCIFKWLTKNQKKSNAS